jgi:hypothetical protein
VSTITIHIRKSRTRWPHRRPQRWHWVAQAANGQTVAQSEMYTNQQDCVQAAMTLFQADVVLRQPGHASVKLRAS